MYTTYILIGLTVMVSLAAWNNGALMSTLIMNPYSVQKRNQWYRLITSGFIHQDQMHLIFNMISLYCFGRAVEMVFAQVFGASGTNYFVALYLLAIVISDIPTLIKHRENPRYNSLGASGGVAALIFAFIIFLPLENIYLFFGIPVPGFILGTLYVIYSWYQGRKSNDNINHDAHLYGAIFGVLFCAITVPGSIGGFFEQIKHFNLTNLF